MWCPPILRWFRSILEFILVCALLGVVALVRVLRVAEYPFPSECLDGFP